MSPALSASRRMLDAARTSWLLAHPGAGGELARHLGAGTGPDGGSLRSGPAAPDGTADPGGEAGMATAEYAIGTLAAAAFAGLLLAIMRSGPLTGMLQQVIESALSVG
ncbi:DUF4244 domain-containing protein [Actinomyces radicidentis]|uniref:DUF4244 domain-containing protein n=1 Tax=Actinomyces radicidentis TaxID=111015 RepID=UPI0026DF72EB|nr:DUF4244 domain-containing protein [Actinomyces radicidentis]